jgi:hypothetical protein
MKLISRESFYSYRLSNEERLALIGILSMLDTYGEISGLDDSSKKLISNLLKEFSQ